MVYDCFNPCLEDHNFKHAIIHILIMDFQILNKIQPLFMRIRYFIKIRYFIIIWSKLFLSYFVFQATYIEGVGGCLTI